MEWVSSRLIIWLSFEGWIISSSMWGRKLRGLLGSQELLVRIRVLRWSWRRSRRRLWRVGHKIQSLGNPIIDQGETNNVKPKLCKIRVQMHSWKEVSLITCAIYWRLSKPWTPKAKLEKQVFQQENARKLTLPTALVGDYASNPICKSNEAKASKPSPCSADNLQEDRKLTLRPSSNSKEIILPCRCIWRCWVYDIKLSKWSFFGAELTDLRHGNRFEAFAYTIIIGGSLGDGFDLACEHVLLAHLEVDAAVLLDSLVDLSDGISRCQERRIAGRILFVVGLRWLNELSDHVCLLFRLINWSKVRVA